ncbi:MAG: LuxR C-terminal-related transcriptional regulator [Flavobacterium sp.]
MKKIISIFLILTGLASSAQELLPFVQNYDKTNYQGDNQVWDVTQGQDRALYFANNHNLLRYNGVVWEQYQLPHKTVIRSVFSDQDRIYSGSYKEFGYWKRSDGKMRYYSISRGKKIFNETDNEEVWKIFKLKNRLYFQSFNALYSYENGRVAKISFPFLISYCFVVEHTIYVASVTQGIFKLVGQKLHPITGWELLKNNVIHGLQKRGAQWFIFTQKNGIFVAENHRIKAWPDPLNTHLKKVHINKAVFVSPEKMVIGSGSNGLYLYDFSRGTYETIHRKNALRNNTVLSIFVDKEKDLWLGLDNGISHVEISSPVAILNDHSGALGSVYAVAQTKPFHYLIASNHGLFEFEQNTLKPLPNTEGHAWNVSKVANDFIIGHNDGTFFYDSAGKLTKINPVNGGWNFVKSRVNASYLQGTYAGIRIYPNPNNFGESFPIKKLDKPIRYVAQIHKHEIWAADQYRGLYRVTIDEQYQTKKIENITQKSRLKNDFGVKLFEFRNKLLFLIHQSWYEFNSLTGTLEHNAWFQSNFKNITDIIPIDDQQFLVISGDLLYHVRANAEQFQWNIIPEKYYRGKIVRNNLKISKTQHKYLLTLDDGFISLPLNFEKKPLVVPIIEAFSSTIAVANGAKIDHNLALKIHVISGRYGANKPNLFYKFDQITTFTPVRRGIITLNHLNTGAHTLSLFHYDGIRYHKVKSFSFTVRPPWYFSVGMIILYLLALGVLFFLYYKWNKLRYIQKLQLKEEELKHLNKVKELEFQTEKYLQIQAYEKHILELELQSKSSEVAGKSLSIAKQTEMMENIQTILASDADLGKLKSDIRKVIKINAVNKHEWEAFENNLNQIHKEFITNLSTSFPNLTPKDIKLCIYLKMNLSSKEIAPMMNISFRGVELHRYRLRKKLELKQEENLTKFLLSL